MRKRCGALLLLLILIPTMGLGEAFSFDISFETAPLLSGDPVNGLMELIEALHLHGTLLASENDAGFDLKLSAALDSDNRSDTDFHLYGVQGMMKAESPLWDDETVLLNIPAALEYGVKMHAHLELPLEQCFFLYPWTSLDAFRESYTRIQNTMHATSGSHIVPYADVFALAEDLAYLIYRDRALQYWFETVSSVNEAGEILQECWLSLPTWVDTISHGENWQVDYNKNREVWSVQKQKILRLETLDDQGSVKLTLLLPKFISGTDAGMTYQCQVQGDTYDVTISFSVGKGESVLLSGQVHATHLPVTWPAKESFEIQCHLKGSLLEHRSFITFDPYGRLMMQTLTDALDFTVQGGPEQVTMLLGDTPAITAHLATASVKDAVMPQHSFDDTEGLNFFSLSDETLKTFVRTHRESMMRGLLPILEYMPISTLQSVMNTLSDGGFFDLLLYGSEESEDWEEYEDWGEEMYDEYEEFEEYDD